MPVELAVDEPGSAFFMRPSQPWRSNRSVQEWPMVALAGARTIRASYSSAFSYEVQLPASLLRQVAAVRGVTVSSRVIDGFGDVTAHFVTETVTSDRRQLQVFLFFDYYPPFARRAKARYLVYCMFVCLFVCLFGQRFLDNPRADSRQSSHAGVLWFQMCLLPFWGLAAPGGRKKGQMKFSLLRESMGNFCILAVFERYLSNACTDPH